MSATLERRPAAPAVPIAQPAEIGRFVWWCFATLILFCAIYFHSKTDPGIRFAVKHSGLTNYGPSWWTQQKFGQFTPGDVAVIAFAYVGFIERLRSGRMAMSSRMAWLLGLGTTAVLMGIAAGIYHETQSPFGDWRDLAIGVLYAFALWSTVLRTDRDCFRFAQIFVGILVVYGAWQLVQYASGGGEIAFYGRTTVGDHATLEFMVAAVGVSMAMLRTHRSRTLWMAGIAVGTAVVVLAFRRYAWVELATVFAAFVLFSGVNRRRYLVSIAGLAALVREGDRTGADVVYGDTLFSDGDGRLTRLLPQHRFSPFVLRSYGCFISTVSCITRTSALGETPIDASMRRMMDWDLYLRLLSEDAAFRHVAVPVGVFRAHDTRVTATERRGFFQRLNRGDGFGREYDMVRDRYGAMRMRRAGHVAHGVLKLADGGYSRQARSRKLHGADLRWWTSPSAAAEWDRVRTACYPAANGAAR